MINFLEFFANIALVSNDIFAVASVGGSILIFIIRVINAFADIRILKAPEMILRWSIMGLFFGTIGSISLVLTGNNHEPLGFLFRLNQQSVAILLFLSFLILMESLILPSTLRRRSW